MKKTKIIKWICPVCKKEWISTIERIWFGKCYDCGYTALFTKETKKKEKWKYVKEGYYYQGKF